MIRATKLLSMGALLCAVLAPAAASAMCPGAPFGPGCHEDTQQCAPGCPALPCADRVKRFDGRGGFFWNAIGHCAGPDKNKVLDCAWSEVLSKYPEVKNDSCMSDGLRKSTSSQQGADGIVKQAQSAPKKGDGPCLLGCDTRLRQCSLGCPLKDGLSCADAAAQLDGQGGFFWNALGHCNNVGQDRNAIADCAWREVQQTYRGYANNQCVKDKLVKGASGQKGIDQVIAAVKKGGTCLLGCDSRFRQCAVGCPLRRDLTCEDSVSQLDGKGGFYWNAVGHCYRLGMAADAAKINACAWEEVAQGYPWLATNACVKAKVAATPSGREATDTVIKAIKADEAKAARAQCPHKDPVTRQCVCTNDEYAAFRRDTTYNPQGAELVAIQMTVTPLTIGTGFTAPQLIQIVKSITGQMQKPWCFGRLMADSFEELKKSAAAVAAANDWHAWERGPDAACTVPMGFLTGMLRAFTAGEFWRTYVPDALKPALMALVYATAPVACTLGMQMWGVKAGVEQGLPILAQKLQDKFITFALGTDVKKAVTPLAHEMLGTRRHVADYSKLLSGMLRAIAAKDRAAYNAARQKLLTETNAWMLIDDDRFADLIGKLLTDLGPAVQEKVRDWAIDQLRTMVKDLAAAPIKMALGTVGEVPYVGGVLAAMITFVTDYAFDTVLQAVAGLFQPYGQRAYAEVNARVFVPGLKLAFKSGPQSGVTDLRRYFPAFIEIKNDLKNDYNSIQASVKQNLTELDAAMNAAAPAR